MSKLHFCLCSFIVYLGTLKRCVLNEQHKYVTNVLCDRDYDDDG